MDVNDTSTADRSVLLMSGTGQTAVLVERSCIAQKTLNIYI